MLKLYSVPVSLYCAKSRIVLRHKALGFEELAPEGGYGSAEYKKRVPSGNLPALIDGDLVLCDSETISEYLEEKHPQTPMLPADLADRARIRDRSRFHDTRLEPALRGWFANVAPEGRDALVVRANTDVVNARLAQLADLLAMGEGADGGVLTLGDCGFAVTFVWIEMIAAALDARIVRPDAVLQYRARITAFPAVAEELTTYLPGMTAWMEAKGARASIPLYLKDITKWNL